MLCISAAVCTHNGAAVLGKALRSLAAQTLPAEQFEVLVIDNASTDSTKAIVEEAAMRQPSVRYIFEAKLGLSQARNTAARAVRSPFIAYLDDDAQAEPQWLETLLEAFETLRPAPACVGGLVSLDWTGSAPPAWLPKKFEALYSGLDLGSEGHFLTSPDEYLIGANMAFRVTALLANGGFDQNLGRKGSRLISGEESALLNRFRANGLPLYYAPAAAVSHFVHPRRRNPKWLVSRVYWDGASQPHIDYGRTKSRRFYALQAGRDIKRLLQISGELLAAFLRPDRVKSAETALSLVQRWGRLRTHLALIALGGE